MAEPFATVADLEARWRPLTPTETTTATALLDDASAMIRAEAPGIDQRVDDGQLDPAVPLMVVCRMVKRAMHTSGDGVTQQQQTAGPFSQMLSFSNPQGDMYLTKADRRMLGIGRQRAFSIDLVP